MYIITLGSHSALIYKTIFFFQQASTHLGHGALTYINSREIAVHVFPKLDGIVVGAIIVSSRQFLKVNLTVNNSRD